MAATIIEGLSWQVGGGCWGAAAILCDARVFCICTCVFCCAIARAVARVQMSARGACKVEAMMQGACCGILYALSLIHISEPTRLALI
eukprot:11421199-Alexandrium_andersonii.AAC.1